MQRQKLQPFLEMPLTLFRSAINAFRLPLAKKSIKKKNHKEKPVLKPDMIGKSIYKTQDECFRRDTKHHH